MVYLIRIKTTAYAMLVYATAMGITACFTIVCGRRVCIRITASSSGDEISSLTHNTSIVNQQKNTLNGITTFGAIGEVLSLELGTPHQWTISFKFEFVSFQGDSLNHANRQHIFFKEILTLQQCNFRAHVLQQTYQKVCQRHAEYCGQYNAPPDETKQCG